MLKGRDHDQNTYVHGTYNAICDVCGFKKKAVDMLSRWDGLFVCKDDWEPRHILDFGRAPHERNGVPIARPDPLPRFKDIPYIMDIEEPEVTWTTIYLNEITAEYSGGPVYGVTVLTDTYNIHQNFGGGIWSVYKSGGLPGIARFTATVVSATPSTTAMNFVINDIPVPVSSLVTLANNEVVFEVEEDTTFSAYVLPQYAPSSGATTMVPTTMASMVLGLVPILQAVVGDPTNIVAQLKVEIQS